MDESTWTVVEIALCVIVIVVHTSGCFCLVYVIKAEEATAQHILIMNASLTEITGTLIYLLYIILTKVLCLFLAPFLAPHRAL